MISTTRDIVLRRADRRLDGFLRRQRSQARPDGAARLCRAARRGVGAPVRGRQGPALALPVRGTGSGHRRARPWQSADPGHGAVRRHPRGDLLATCGGLQEPRHRHPARLVRGRLVRPRAQVRRVRRGGDHGPRPRARPRAHHRRRRRVRARDGPLLGPRDGRTRGAHPQRDGAGRQGAFDRPGRREPRALRLPVHRPVPQGRPRRRRGRDGQQEPQGRGRARHGRGHGGRRAGLHARRSWTCRTSACSPPTTPGPTRRARRSW